MKEGCANHLEGIHKYGTFFSDKYNHLQLNKYPEWTNCLSIFLKASILLGRKWRGAAKACLRNSQRNWQHLTNFHVLQIMRQKLLRGQGRRGDGKGKTPQMLGLGDSTELKPP